MCELRSMSDQSNTVKTSPSMIGTVQLLERVAPSPCPSFRGGLRDHTYEYALRYHAQIMET
jgi:hypothetical protein